MTPNFFTLIQQNGTVSLLGLIWYILVAAGLWRMFEKAHVAGWKAIIPIYNFYLLFKISWTTNMFWGYILCQLAMGILLGFSIYNPFLYYVNWALSIVFFIIRAVLIYNVSLSYGHGVGYFLGLYLFEPIFIMIIGFGSSQYVGNRYQAGSYYRF